MKNHRLIVFGLVMVLAGFNAGAAVDLYQFKNDESRDRFRMLTAELRCPKCQNQNIADSNAPIASDLRNKIHQMLMEEQSDQEIVDYMIERYGDFVLYEPQVKPSTFALWYGPYVLLLLGIIVVVLIGRKSRSTVPLEGSTELDNHQQKQLKQLLEDNKDKTL